MKKFEISVIVNGHEHKFSVEEEDKQAAVQKAAKEFYKYFGSDTKVDGYVVNEVI